MRLWSTSRPASWFLGLRARHRVQPCEYQGYREDGGAHPTAGRAKIHRLLGIHQPFHQSAGREGSSPVPAHEEDHFFEWNDKANGAFFQLKKMFTTPPVLAAPTAKEPMLLYIAATSRVVSTVIVVEHCRSRDPYIT